jgi:hypothetical protein
MKQRPSYCKRIKCDSNFPLSMYEPLPVRGGLHWPDSLCLTQLAALPPCGTVLRLCIGFYSGDLHEIVYRHENNARK